MTSIEALQGKFIVIEGTDGAGTTLQAQQLVTKLTELGVACEMAHEPTNHLPVGRLIRSFLTKQLPAPSWETMALLFAADRLDHCEEIKAHIRQRITIVSDRYTLSSYIYQTLTVLGDPHARLAWIHELNSRAIVPDHLFVLNVPAAVARDRRQRRDGGDSSKELFEQDDLQERVCRAYSKPEHWLPARERSVPTTVIDGAQPPDVVAGTIALVLELP